MEYGIQHELICVPFLPDCTAHEEDAIEAAINAAINAGTPQHYTHFVAVRREIQTEQSAYC